LDMSKLPTVRLDKLLATLGLTTRGTCKKFIHKFEVKVNGLKPLKTGLHVLPSEITIGGKPLEYPKPLTIILHKPVGYVCTRKKDPQGDGRPIYDLLPPSFVRRRPLLVSAGRLDRWASGLLVMSQNGSLVNQIATPKRKQGVFGKVYEVKLLNSLSGHEAKRFASGDLKLRGETKPCKPAKLEVIDQDAKLVRITLYEGKYHQVRRMLAAVGNKVVEIKRISTGAFHLGDLPVGHWREVTQEELDLSGLDLKDDPTLVTDDMEEVGGWDDIDLEEQDDLLADQKRLETE